MYYVAITDNSKLKGVEFADIIDCPTANFPIPPGEWKAESTILG